VCTYTTGPGDVIAVGGKNAGFSAAQSARGQGARFLTWDFGGWVTPKDSASSSPLRVYTLSGQAVATTPKLRQLRTCWSEGLVWCFFGMLTLIAGDSLRS
jgi:hypothetical protein